MDLHIFESKAGMGAAAAQRVVELLKGAISERGVANVILATGVSQFEMLAQLVQQDIDWSKVTAFHLDEYIGLPELHPASFRNYLQARFVDKVPTLKQFHFVNGEAADPQAECDRVGALISACSIDVACIGIGENGHIAFNDPPADFETESPYLVVDLDEACRRQQLGEGWFPTLNDVPAQAISMSVRQIMKSVAIVCTVPDARKATAVKNSVQGAVSNLIPASILQHHPHCAMFMDTDSAALLSKDI